MFLIKPTTRDLLWQIACPSKPPENSRFSRLPCNFFSILNFFPGPALARTRGPARDEIEARNTGTLPALYAGRLRQVRRRRLTYEGRYAYAGPSNRQRARSRHRRRRNHDRVCDKEVRSHRGQHRSARESRRFLSRSKPLRNDPAEQRAHHARSMRRPIRSASGQRKRRHLPPPPTRAAAAAAARAEAVDAATKRLVYEVVISEDQGRIQVRIGGASRARSVAHRPDDRRPQGQSARQLRRNRRPHRFER